MVANIVVRQFPPKLSLKIDVNKEFLKMETTKVPWLNKGSNLKQKVSQKSTIKFHSLSAYYLSDEKLYCRI